MGSIFIGYGTKAAGGPAFLKRTRSAESQLQTRTATATSTSQLQTRTRSASITVSSINRWELYYLNYCGFYTVYDSCDNYLFAQTSAGWWETLTCAGYNIYTCGYAGCNDSLCEMVLKPYGVAVSSCNWSGWSGWSNTSSCSTSYPGCSTGAVQRECQTLTSCSFGAFTEWSNVSSCTPASPACTNGAVQRECQTVYNWGEWSAYEEVDVCTSQSPALGAGAVEIECVPQ